MLSASLGVAQDAVPGRRKQGEALYALTIQIKGQTGNDGDPVTLCGGQQGGPLGLAADQEPY